MTRTGRQSGFTLIELLVSLVLLGLMMSLIGLVVPLAMSGAVRTSALSDEYGAIENAQHLLRRQISEMPALVTHEGYISKTVFSGKPDSMRFAADPVAAQGSGGPRMVELSAERKGAVMRLIYRSGGETRDLVTNAGRIGFAYYGALSPARGPVWQDRWQGAPRPPLLVRIRVQTAEGALPWPDLIIAVMAGPPPP